MVIWKFELEVTDMQEVTMPDGAELLSVTIENTDVHIQGCGPMALLYLWAMVDPSKEKRRRCIEIIGCELGEDIEESTTCHPSSMDMGVDRKFIGTAVADPFVWHVFERR